MNKDVTQQLIRSATKLVILLGLVSLFADMTYEGARSITGPYLALLGASATVVGFVAGLGELMGYALRLLSGRLSDQTGRYWTITVVGYALNLFAVPLLALAGRWEIAALLILMERAGKAIRTPARDAILSHATHEMGRGWGFGLHRAMDQVGATLGPLMMAGVLYFKGGYQVSFGVLLIPALAALSVLCLGPLLYPRPQDLEAGVPMPETQGLPRVFWIYLAAVACIAAGYADFPLIAYHFKKAATVPDVWIPSFYAVAMAADALAAIFFGRIYDRNGIGILLFASVLSALVAPLVFWGGFYWALVGMALWGIGMGAQGSVLKAAVAEMVSANKRGSTFGVFHTGYGVAWFLGSTLMGFLYDFSVTALVAFSVALQLISLPLFAITARLYNKSRKQ